MHIDRLKLANRRKSIADRFLFRRASPASVYPVYATGSNDAEGG